VIRRLWRFRIIYTQSGFIRADSQGVIYFPERTSQPVAIRAVARRFRALCLCQLASQCKNAKIKTLSDENVFIEYVTDDVTEKN